MKLKKNLTASEELITKYETHEAMIVREREQIARHEGLIASSRKLIEDFSKQVEGKELRLKALSDLKKFNCE